MEKKNILLQESFAITETDNAGDVHDKMKEIGAQLLLRTVKGLADGSLKEKAQLSTLNFQLSTLQHAPKIFTETCKIDFTKTVDEVYNLIRGLAPYPAAFTFLQDKKLKVYKAEKIHNTSIDTPGSFKTDSKTYLHFACSDGYISMLELQLEGKKKMNIADFLRGYRF
jgi:methionyl-tRNA formyltransferase